MARFVILGLSWMLAMACARAHVVEQFHAAVRDGGIEILFDVGYADPRTRDDPFAPQPTREWLVSLDAGEHARLRERTLEYLRAYLSLAEDVAPRFPDFDSDPPDFERLLTGGAYYRVHVPVDGVLELASGNVPDLALRFADGTYRTLEPGGSVVLRASGGGRGAAVDAFRSGFLHVLPAGLDHILFILAIFLLVREWKPLLWSSLAFTVAHTITLGLGAAGVFSPASRWIAPLIALSIATLAVENLFVTRFHVRRLVWIFAFGLVHGMGFANSLARGLGEGGGFALRLVCANLGVEAAQVVILANAWMLTSRIAGKPAWGRFRLAANVVLAVVSLLWLARCLG